MKKRIQLSVRQEAESHPHRFRVAGAGPRVEQTGYQSCHQGQRRRARMARSGGHKGQGADGRRGQAQITEIGNGS